MRSERVEIKLLLAAGILLAALGIRFWALGEMPLARAEAELALEADRVASLQSMAGSPQPLYVSLTAAAFFLLGDTNFTARFMPALAGSLLVLLPLLFWRKLGWNTALLLAAGFAIDPALAAFSRQASAAMLALFCFIAGAGAWSSKRPFWAGFFASAGLLGGLPIWGGVLGLLLALVLGRYLPGLGWGWLQRLLEREREPAQAVDWRLAGLGAAAALALLGSWLMLLPGGLSAAIGSLPVYLSGFAQPSGIPALRLALGMLLLQPLPVIFGVLGAVRGWREQDGLERWLSLWALAALLVVLIYPGRQAHDLLWVTFPLWLLAARELNRLLFDGEEFQGLGWLHAGLVFLLLAITWLNLAAIDPRVTEQTMLLRWVLVAGILLIGVAASLFVGLGWSWRTARFGAVLGASGALALALFGNALGAAVEPENRANEVYFATPAAGEIAQLLTTVEDLAEWRTGRTDSLDAAVVADAAELRWALRNMPNVYFAPSLKANELPSAILAPAAAPEPSLAIAYRGQDFSLRVSPDWGSALPANWLEWLLYRKGDVVKDQVILWVRSDVLPGGETIFTAPAAADGQAPVNPLEFDPAAP